MESKTPSASISNDVTTNFPRRDFLKMLGGASAVAAVQGSVGVWPLQAAQASTAIGDRRNLILFLTDQERSTMWFGNDPEAWEEQYRPALTELKKSGVTFNLHFSNTSMCTPARNTLFTGHYAAQHRAPDVVQEVNVDTPHDNQLDPTLPNLATILKAAGYEVVYKGKWHLTDGTVQPDGTKISDDPARYGFDGWFGPDIGADSNPARLYGGGGSLATQSQPTQRGGYQQDGRIIDGYDCNYNDNQGGINPEYANQSVLSYLQNKIDNPGTQPFCLVVSLVNPHDLIGYPTFSGDYPSVTPTPVWGYSPSGQADCTQWSPVENSQESVLYGTLTTPPTFSENLILNFKPTTQEKYNKLTDLVIGPVPGEGTGPSGSGTLNYYNMYANLCRMVDNEFKKVLDLIRGTNLRNNSWIVYTSDHGELGTSHGGLKEKGFCAYEETIKVPMVWSNPADFSSGSKVFCNQLVSHVDFLPTVCEKLLGINPRQYNFSGVSYSSLIKNPNGPAIQDSILCTFDDIYAGQSSAQFPNGIVPPPNRVRMIRDLESKYVYYFDSNGIENPQDEFYDIRKADNGGTDTDFQFGGTSGLPTEFNNLSITAENLRRLAGQEPKASASLIAKRTSLMEKLQVAVRTKLNPFVTKRPVPPQDFDVEVLNYKVDGITYSDLQLTWLSRNTTQYQVQMSRDQVTWTNVGAPIPGTNGPMLVSQPVTDFQAFYRLLWSANQNSTIVPNPQRLTLPPMLSYESYLSMGQDNSFLPIGSIFSKAI